MSASGPFSSGAAVAGEGVDPGWLGGAAGFSATATNAVRGMVPVVLAQAVLTGNSGGDCGAAGCMGLTGVMSPVLLSGGGGTQIEAGDATGSIG